MRNWKGYTAQLYKPDKVVSFNEELKVILLKLLILAIPQVSFNEELKVLKFLLHPLIQCRLVSFNEELKDVYVFDTSVSKTAGIL